MATDPVPPALKVARPHSFGWLRRSDLESPNYPHIHVWEKPNGGLYNHNAKDGALVFVFGRNSKPEPPPTRTEPPRHKSRCGIGHSQSVGASSLN